MITHFQVIIRDFRAFPYVDDLDMEELSNRVIGKLRDMTDEEFEELGFAVQYTQNVIYCNSAF